MSREHTIEVALQLMKLGVSQSGVERLLNEHPIEEIEKQLRYLPFRNAKRPEAMIVESIRKRYSAPKDFFHAKTQSHAPSPGDAVDQGA